MLKKMTSMSLYGRAKNFTRIDKKTASEMNKTIVNTKKIGENTEGNNTCYFTISLIMQIMTKKLLVNV